MYLRFSSSLFLGRPIGIFHDFLCRTPCSFFNTSHVFAIRILLHLLIQDINFKNFETWENQEQSYFNFGRESRDSVVGIATSYGLDYRGVGVRVPVLSRIFYSPRRPDRLGGPPNLLGALSQGLKRPGREADRSPPSSAEVKKMWIYTSTPPYAFMA
jgi:hypothetical protein